MSPSCRKRPPCHADSICVGYAEESWPELLRDFAVGQDAPALRPGRGFRARSRSSSPSDTGSTGGATSRRPSSRRRGPARMRASSASCPRPGVASNIKSPSEHVVEDIRRFGARRNIFVDLNLISDRAYARALFTALIPLRIRWFGLVTSLIGRDPDLMALMAESGCSGVLIGFESISPIALKRRAQRLQQARRLRTAHRRAASRLASRSTAASSSAGTRTTRTSSTRRHASSSRPASTCRASPSRRRFRARRSTCAPGARGADHHAGLVALRRPARRLRAQAHERASAADGP